MIGAIVGVIAIFIGFSDVSKKRDELSIVHQFQEKMSGQWLPSEKFKLFHSGANYDISRAVLDYYLIINISDGTLKASDFVSPITVYSPDENSKIVSVESCSEKYAQSCSISGDARIRNDVETSWKFDKKLKKWTSGKSLFNPGDVACVIVVTEQSQDNRPSEKINLLWNARIEGSSVVNYKNIEVFRNSFGKSIEDYFNIGINLNGSGIFWILILFSTLFVVTVKLGHSVKVIEINKISGILVLLGFALISISTAEILVDIFVNQKGNLFSEEIHQIVWPLLVIHSYLFIHLSVKALKR